MVVHSAYLVFVQISGPSTQADIPRRTALVTEVWCVAIAVVRRCVIWAGRACALGEFDALVRVCGPTLVSVCDADRIGAMVGHARF